MVTPGPELQLRSKPFIFAVGLEKCGTTSLSNYLRLAKNVAVPIPKELEYFSNNYERGAGWYLNQYDASKQVFVDMTPGYHWNTEYLTRIQADCDRKAVLLLLRHPIERAYSAYTHQRYWFFESEFKRNAAGYLNKTFAEAAEGGNAFLFPSYTKLIAQVFSVFGRDVSAVIPLEILLTDPLKPLNFVESVLSCTLDIDRSAVMPRSNSLFMPQFFTGRELMELNPEASSLVPDLDATYISRGGMPTLIAGPEAAASLKEMEKKWLEPVSSEVAFKAFARYYEKETDEIEKLLGVNLDAWRVVKRRRPKTLIPLSAHAARETRAMGIWWARKLMSNPEGKGEALAFLRGQTESQPSEPEYHFMLAQLLLEAGDMEGADRHSLAAYDLGPTNAPYGRLRGRVLKLQSAAG
jgi:hypothetical protein